MTLSNNLPLELRQRAKNAKHQIRARITPRSKHQRLFDKPNLRALIDGRVNKAPQIHHRPGKPVNARHNENVTRTEIIQAGTLTT